MKVTKNLDCNVYTLAVEGRVDMLNSAEFQRETESGVSKLRGKSGTFVIDFAELKYISSAGLRVLLACHKQMMGIGGKLSIINVIPSVMEIFEVTGFSDVLDIKEKA